jgi:SAM-dependent methyltransferase
MIGTARHDAWQSGANYDAFMGRWSRRIAPLFLERLDAPEGLDWLDVGCGTGALSEAVLARCRPESVIGFDPSDDFVARAVEMLRDPRATFRVGDAQDLPVESFSRDIVVSGLVLNFVPDRAKALAEMKRVTRPGGRVGFYVWDYPGGGMEFLRAFWDAATELDPGAAELAEGRRFADCEPAALTGLATAAGLTSIRCEHIETPALFRDFDDFWLPFTRGAGPAPGYCASLDPEARDRLREALSARLPYGDDGTIALKLRAWAVRARAD